MINETHSKVLNEVTVEVKNNNNHTPPNLLIPPVTCLSTKKSDSVIATLVLKDGTNYQGYSFGAESRSVAGECVFQTGMVGYPESLTDPSYRGQILVLTFPLVGNYGTPSRDSMEPLLKGIPKYFESREVHITGLVIGQYSQNFSHYLASSSLSDWLKENNIPAIYGIDTRALTKKIRTKVSIKEPNLFKPDPLKAITDVKGNTLRIIVVDVGMVSKYYVIVFLEIQKYNQLRCFINRGVEVLVVPWDYNFNMENNYHGLFVSNGPGDPAMAKTAIEHLKTAIKEMKYGNRGHNIPCTDMISGRCYITSQNHGYAVDTNTLPSDFQELFVNANDGSNEGIIHKHLPIFSVQFHPEASPGPRDTEYLFDVFIESVKQSNLAGKLIPLKMPGGTKEENQKKNSRVNIRKVLVLGSGGLSIGQAGEFDYSGTLNEEGIYTILINPNIATIQTSHFLADKVFFLPVNPDFVLKVIKFEKPDGIYVTFGGQTALNVGIKLKDRFKELGIKVLGTPIDTIIATEDREFFVQKMLEIGEKCAESASATNTQEALEAAQKINYPVICRAAYALGGLGSGFAEDETQLNELCSKAFATSPQVLIERSMKGWKEIEYEIIRDCRDNCISVCNMENFDPLGIHTGDSIVVAPSQTLSDDDYHMLRTTAVNVVRHLGVVGECNIQYALNPFSKEYCIIEVNARLSRSSALASKATGYPLAFVAAKLGLGIPLNEINNSMTKVTCACFEPSLDYVVVKIPRWDLKKFTRVDKSLSSSMKSVGEVMSIGRTFEETIQKAIRAIEFNFMGFGQNDLVDDIESELINPSDLRLFAIANAMHKGYTVDQIWKFTKIDKWFLYKLQNIIILEKQLKEHYLSVKPDLLLSAKQLGFSDRQIAKAVSSNELAIRMLRKEHGIIPFVKQIDTVAAEFPAQTNYLYITYNAAEHDISFEEKGVMVLGSGVYRIGSSVEFDWCAVRAMRTLRENNLKTIMVNYNPETVSTDYDEADRLYFENITLERVLDIYEIEKSAGVIISMGGQTPNNIAMQLERQNVKTLGTSATMIDTAENRYKFSRMLDQIGVDQPEWKELASHEEVYTFCKEVQFPVLVRPSYVLSGAAMNVAYSLDDLSNFLSQATAVSREHPVVISKYIEEAKEIEMDAVAVEGKLVMHVISEHVENAGVHSGDATLVLPPQDLDPETVRKIELATQKIGDALNVTGPFNIQFIAKNNEIKVIECNVRASRSFPFVSKVMGVDLIEMSTLAILGVQFEHYPQPNLPKNYVAVKVPQFSFSRLSGADPILGVEMASTGEVACFGRDKYEAYLKALISTGMTINMPQKNILLSIGSFKEKNEMLPSVEKLHQMGYNLFATSGTADYIQEHGLPVKYLESLEESEHEVKYEYSLQQHLANNLIDLYINLPSKNRFRRPASYMSKGYRTRRMAVDYDIPLITNVKCAKLFIEALSRSNTFEILDIDYKTRHKRVTLPGLINISAFVPHIIEPNYDDFSQITKASLASGFTTIVMMPIGLTGSLHNPQTIAIAHSNGRRNAHCDFSLSVAVIENNYVELTDVVPNITLTFIPFSDQGVKIPSMDTIKTHFKTWPSHVPIITDAKGKDLSHILFMADLLERTIHVTNVATKEDIELIALSKEKGKNVTCDVSVHALFLNNNDVPNSINILPSPSDQAALWERMEDIDCFSVGKIPYLLSQAVGAEAVANVGIEETLPLLTNAINEGRLTLEDIKKRLYTNPREIFDLPEQLDTRIEVEIDRKVTISQKEGRWSPFTGKTLIGAVSRVVLRGETVYLDGGCYSSTNGKDISTLAHVITKTPSAVKETFATIKDAAYVPQQNLTNHISDIISPPLGPREISSKSIVPELFSFETPHAILPTNIASIINYSPFLRKNILSVNEFTRNDLHLLFGIAHEMRTLVERYGTINLLQGRVMVTLFYEPSTRTSASFQAAMYRLGGRVISINVEASSVSKGETLEDTIRTLGSYGDVIVLRHPEAGSVKTAAKFSPVPIINAGDGIGEHPSQAFLDVYTIREELGTVNGLTVTIVGDLKNGRTVHSLVRILSQYQVSLNYVSPASLRMPEEVKAEVRKTNKIEQKEYVDLDEVIAETDVLYMTRIQRERFDSVEEYNKVKSSYVVNNATLSKSKPHMIVMHPLPRVDEVDPEVDFDDRAAYFRQVKYGMFVRMALLALILGKYS
ncbi:6999_t:CDS:10 [Diversispora eburnea]|uniref:Ammonium-dependent carbamoyl phosphate synthetase n=1 Tax=Diversispora eburnea TaxID=1213867 RepID=A0A9N8YK70_9GLOM|nr:6999_t:CDS:10 [Diversispora eburnea]